jgi:hypothetical protein
MDVPAAEFAIPADYKELNPPGTGKTDNLKEKSSQ